MQLSMFQPVLCIRYQHGTILSLMGLIVPFYNPFLLQRNSHNISEQYLYFVKLHKVALQNGNGDGLLRFFWGSAPHLM